MIYTLGIASALILLKFISIRLNKTVWDFFKDGAIGDSISYIYLTQFYRNNKFGDSDSRSLLSNGGVYLYSIFISLMSTFFSDYVLFKKSWLPNFIIFSISTTIFLFVLFFFEFEITQILIISIFFLFQPDNLFYDKDRIQYQTYQPRYLGLVVNSLAWLIIVFSELSLVTFSSIIILFIISINNSYFGRQSTFFVSFFYALIAKDFYPLLAFISSCILSLFIFRRKFYDVVKYSFPFYKNYFLNYPKPQKSENLIYYNLKLIFSSPLYASRFYFGFLVTSIIFLILFYSSERSNFVDISNIHYKSKISFFLISISLIFIITSYRKFAFLGECWRYISFCSYYITPIIFYELLDYFFTENTIKFFVISIYVFMYILLIYFLQKNYFSKNKNSSLLKLLNKHKEKFKNAIWYGIPFRAPTLAVVLGFGKKTTDFEYGNKSKKLIDKNFSIYPYLKWDKEILKTNKISHIILENKLEDEAVKLCNFSSDNLKLIDKNSEYSIYKLK